ncbi:hypothetical protein POM88_009590 [Heracleum sosnowskyi]|uniref:Large ribosomal subunit protein uL4 C-terminal domain-containing protein n=1 Tax=Heracleum sosnowskyi TaxID=360622 RepID=A0AAD8M046_9APIA|nr:hypothetical protein POM88_048040 [Heracleum sosnowskyi]KAK1399727.1 hypothetical protein POM88_009590 [Heracleum sosnowskyi]
MLLILLNFYEQICLIQVMEIMSYFKEIGAYPDAEKAKDSIGIGPGKGKMRNIPGIEIANLERLNLLKLAPGIHLGRSKLMNADLARIINSDEIQSVVRPIKKDVKRATLKKNPLKNLNTMLRLNPYAKTAMRMSLLAEAQRVKSKKEKIDRKRKPLTKVSNCAD